MAGPCLTAPKSLLSSRTLPLGAPAFSSPPASQQQQWQKVRLDGALEAQRRGPPPRDAGDADGGGGNGGGGGGGNGGGGGDLPFMPDHDDEQDQILAINSLTSGKTTPEQAESSENAPDYVSELALA